MLFPIGDDQVTGRYKPLVSYILIGLNILAFIFQISIPPGGQLAFVMEYGMIPAEIVQGEHYYTLITNMFLHAGWLHLIGNMLFLWVFADNIESVIGKFPFILFYFGGGIAASAAHIFFNMNSSIPVVGASGAISAVLGAYLVMFPASRVRVFFIIFLRSYYMPALYFLGIWGIQQFINGFISIVPTSAYSSGVAWWAHIGGFIFGIVAGFLIRRIYEPRSPFGRSSESFTDYQ
jgi:membrane associated rhomboid family serine protease